MTDPQTACSPISLRLAAIRKNLRGAVRHSWAQHHTTFAHDGSPLLRKYAGELQLPVGLNYGVLTPLLVVGREGWGVTELCARLRSQDSRHIKWVSRVSNEDLGMLMAGARALAFPSLYEGFGLPIIEAFSVGVPVLAANKTAIPEVAAGAALLFDPENVASIAESMVAIFESSALREELRNAGRERANCFSWGRTTDQTIEVYRNVIS